MQRSVFFLLLLPSLLFGQVHSVTVWWSPGHCNQKCGVVLVERFKRAKEIADANVNLASGEAKLVWKEKRRFSYRPIKRIMQAAGVGVNRIEVKVSGTLQEKKNRMYLISSGDKTRFLLMAPAPVRERRYATTVDPRVYPIDANLKQKLLRFGSDADVMLSGPLYRPSRAGDPTLIVDGVGLAR